MNTLCQQQASLIKSSVKSKSGPGDKMWLQNVANTVLSNDSCIEGLELMLMMYEQMLEVFSIRGHTVINLSLGCKIYYMPKRKIYSIK